MNNKYYQLKSKKLPFLTFVSLIFVPVLCPYIMRKGAIYSLYRPKGNTSVKVEILQKNGDNEEVGDVFTGDGNSWFSEGKL